MATLFDLDAIPGDDPTRPNLAPVLTSAGASQPEVRLVNPNAIPGDDPVAASPAPALPVLLSLSVTVGYVPNALTSALQIMETGQVFGPYPDSAVANGDGTYSLTIGLTALPAGLLPGLVSVQPGDVLGGVFVPAAGVGPIAGTLSLAGAPAPAAAADVDWSLGPPQMSVFDASSNSLVAGSDGFLHVLVGGTSNETGQAVNPAGNPVALAVTPGTPGPGDFQAADWLPVTLPGAAAPQTFARLALSAALGNTLDAGNYRVYLRINGTTTLRVPSYLSVGS